MRFAGSIILLLLAACVQEVTPTDAANWVTVDNYRIDVRSLGGRQFEAVGGEATHDRWVKYRQVRAVEVISLCRVKESHYEGKRLHATVDCPHPRQHL